MEGPNAKSAEEGAEAQIAVGPNGPPKPSWPHQCASAGKLAKQELCVQNRSYACKTRVNARETRIVRDFVILKNATRTRGVLR
jgi:hypothetical protein